MDGKRCVKTIPFLHMVLRRLSVARVNSVMFYVLWMCAPILVSIISFFTYVMLGNELTVSVAFTVSYLLFTVIGN